MENHITREQLANELTRMRNQLESLDSCKEQLEVVQRRYEKLLDSAPDAMLFVNKEARIMYVNAQLEKLFGYSQDELVGQNLQLLIPEQYRESHRDNVEKYFRTPRARPMGTGLQIYGRKKDGTEFPADISLSPLEANGELLAIAAIRDVTERKLAESRIERNYLIQRSISTVLKIALEPIPLEQQLEKVLQLILWIPGIAPRSQGYIYLLENEPEVLVLKTKDETADRGFGPCEKISFGKCLCGKAASTCTVSFVNCLDERHEIRFSRESDHGHYCVPIVAGERTLGLINLVLEKGHERTDEEEEFLVAVANTLATLIERHKAESERDMFRQQLAESEKIAALGRMTANVAHDIRNPLTAIGGFARRLEKRMSGMVKEKDYVEFIISEVNRLESILRNILSFSRGASFHIEECDVNTIAEEALRVFEEACSESSITIETSFTEGAIIEADRERVLEAVENLISNAVDAMPLGGTLTLVTERKRIKGELSVSVRVSDTGEGIKEENLGRIFEPLFSTKIASKGIGLGLPITKKIVEDLKGTIRVDSKEGKGTSFSLFFRAR